MKTLSRAFALLLILTLVVTTSELTAQSKTNTDGSTELSLSPTLEDATGTWEIITSTPRGKRNTTFRIVEENGGLVGYGPKGNVPVTQEGNLLTWSATIESPRGAIDVKNTAELNGDTMEGTVEMLSGPMSGRTLSFTGTRER